MAGGGLTCVCQKKRSQLSCLFLFCLVIVIVSKIDASLSMVLQFVLIFLFFVFNWNNDAKNTHKKEALDSDIFRLILMCKPMLIS